MSEEMSLQVVYNAIPVAQKIGNMPMPAKAAYRISKLLRKLRSEFKSIEAKRLELYKKYGTINPKDGSYTVNEDKMQEFTQDMDVLMATKSDLEFQPITITLFEGTNLTASDIVNMGPFMVEADPQEKTLEKVGQS